MKEGFKENFCEFVAGNISVVHTVFGISSVISTFRLAPLLGYNLKLGEILFLLVLLCIPILALSVYVDDWMSYRKAISNGVHGEGTCLNIQRVEHIRSFVIRYEISI